jgi:hypothetical protein
MALPLLFLLLTPNAVPHVRLVNPAMVVAAVAQEAIGRLARPFRQMRAPSNLCLLNLPLEIILMIATYLDECALVSLALTCRSLHGLWERRNLPLQLAEKEKLLLSLEKDIPFLYYCHHCVKLHRWHGRWSRSIAPWYEERLPCKRSLDKHLYIPLTCHIPYYYARLVMNRHFYGSKHGLPLHVLNKRAQSYSHSDGVVNSVSQHARIFNESRYHSEPTSTLMDTQSANISLFRKDVLIPFPYSFPNSLRKETHQANFWLVVLRLDPVPFV